MGVHDTEVDSLVQLDDGDADRNVKHSPIGGLHGLWQSNNKVHYSKPAVISPSQTLTHGELDNLSRKLAVALTAKGIRAGDRVAIIMEKGIEEVVAVFAVLRCNAVYIPIELGLATRTKLLLKKCSVQYALTQSWVSESKQWGEKVECITVDLPHTWVVPNDSYFSRVVASSSLAYIIFTSGTTGTAKGVMIEHGSALNTVIDINNRFGINMNDRILGLSALSFDLSVYDLFGILGVGGALVIPEPQNIKDPASWCMLLNSEKISVWNTVPTLFDMLITHMELSNDLCNDKVLPDLRVVFLSGDWIPLDLIKRARKLLPGVKLVSLGGATEASIWSIIYEIKEHLPGWKSIPYGSSLSNQNVYVLDSSLTPCSENITGELYIGGVGLARGYLDDEELTRKKFIIHPETSELLYRTGDLGRCRTGGIIEFLGRIDNQLKIRGYRIEPGEIEFHLLQRDDVARVLVTSYGSEDKKKLVAYLQLNNRVKISNHEVKKYLSDKIPNYMIPSSIIVLNSFPLTQNGKIDRSSLPIPTRNVKEDIFSSHDNSNTESQPISEFPKNACQVLPDGSSKVENVQTIRNSILFDGVDWGQFKIKSAQANVSPTIALCTAFSELLAKHSMDDRLILLLETSDLLPLNIKNDRIVDKQAVLILLEIQKTGSSFSDRVQEVQHKIRLNVEDRHYNDKNTIHETHQYGQISADTALPIIFSSIHSNKNQTNLDRARLTCSVMETNNGVSIHWDHLEDIFESDLISDMCNKYHLLLKNLARKPLEWYSVSGDYKNGNVNKYDKFPDKPQMSTEEKFNSNNNKSCDEGLKDALDHLKQLEKATPDVEIHNEPKTGSITNVITDSQQRALFTLGDKGHRNLGTDHETIRLKDTPYEHLTELYADRKSHRSFKNDSISLQKFSAWIEPLRGIVVSEKPTPKYRYPSAGGLYPVQIYIWIKDQMLDHVSEGGYLYDRKNHILRNISNFPFEITAFGSVNIDAAADAAFAVALVADKNAIEPMYGQLSRDFCLIEAGCILQILMRDAVSFNIGLCPVGGIGNAAFKSVFDFGKEHEVLHAILGGGVVEAEEGVSMTSSLNNSILGKSEEMVTNNVIDTSELIQWMENRNETLPDSEEATKHKSIPDHVSSPKNDINSVLPTNIKKNIYSKENLVTVLLSQWRKVLEDENIDIDDRLFDIGATSVHAVRVRIEIEKYLSHEVPIVYFFEYPTINALASYLTSDEFE